MNIGYVGLGKLGLACAEKIVDKGYHVKGFDIDEIESDKIEICSTIKNTVNIICTLNV